MADTSSLMDIPDGQTDEAARGFYFELDASTGLLERVDRSPRPVPLDPVIVLRCRDADAIAMRGPDLLAITLPATRTGHTVVITQATGHEPPVHAVRLMVPRAAFTRNLITLLGTEAVAPIVFDREVDIMSDAGATLARMVIFVADEIRRPAGALAVPMVASNLADALVHHMLLRLPHNHVARLHAPVRAAEPAYLEKAEEFLAANADRPVSNVELARQVGVSVRALQLAFRRHRDSSPQQFLRDRRLELAHRKLGTRNGGTVSDIAFASGFTHLGRFSVEYRHRYGESPSETRRRHTR